MDNNLDISAEPFSKVSFSGLGLSVDACLDKPAGLRLRDEEQMAFFMMLEKTKTTLFSYDIASDILYFLKIAEDGSLCERKSVDFSETLKRLSVEGNPEVVKVAKNVLEARNKKTEGNMEYTGSMISDIAQHYQLNYQSVTDADGKVYAIIGYVSCIESVEDTTAESKFGEFVLYEEKQLEEKIDTSLKKLQFGEKGVLFLLSIQNLEKMEERQQGVYLRALVDSIKADFRDEDVLGKVNDNMLAVFICGHTSIDIIERRAQRIIDLSVRVPMSDAQATLCNIGVAATGCSGKKSYDTMLREAKLALKSSIAHGKNQYRLFEDEKY